MTTIAACLIGLPRPKRQRLQLEALQSVWMQNRPPDDLVLGSDFSERGQVWNANRVLKATDAEWVAFLDDDDLWLPEHLAVCEKFIDSYEVDVVVSRYKMVGRPEHTIEPWHPNFEDLRWTNWVGSPSMVVARREVFEQWCEPYGRFRWIDWANYNRLLEKGARFVDTQQVTTVYRFGDWGNGSW